MLAAVLLALQLPSAPLALWPAAAGPPVAVVGEVDFYLAEPEDDFVVLALQPLPAPLGRAEEAALARLARLAVRLGADAVMLLGELPEEAIPSDPAAPLPANGRYAMAAFLLYADAADDEAGAVRGAQASRRPRESMSSPPPPSRMKITDCTTIFALSSSPATAR